MLAKYLLGVQPNNKIYVEDVFSADPFPGQGTATTITNGIDLAGKGGMVWTKSRSNSNSNYINTTNSPAQTYVLRTESTAAEGNESSSVSSFNSNGFTGWGGWNGVSLVSWTFRKAPKFFDTVRWSGTANQTISHSLGVAPGMIIVKRFGASEDWWVYHRSLTNSIKLNLTGGELGFSVFSSVTSSSFNVNLNSTTGPSDGYVAYIFAHDTGIDGMIQCGSVTDDGNGTGVFANLGWEPQWLLVKRFDGGAENWSTIDSARGLAVKSVGDNSSALSPNTSAAEGAVAAGNITSTGWWSPTGRALNQKFLYVAIRRPMKTPTLGTQVYNAITYTGSGGGTYRSGAGFVPDSIISFSRSGDGNGPELISRLRGGSRRFLTPSTAGELTLADPVTFNMDGITTSGTVNSYIDYSGYTKVLYFFKRAPGFMDEVCYAGTGANATLTHNLGVIPELVIYKGRSNSFNWLVYNATIGVGNYLALNSTAASAASLSTYWNSTPPTASSLYVGSHVSVNESGQTFVAYLFATLPGVSKVGSFVGNGTSQTINCGFSAGARFVMIKDTTSSGNWFVSDSSRGIIAANDPVFQMNTANAEFTSYDWVDPDSTGFIVNIDLVNTNGNTYVYLAIA